MATHQCNQTKGSGKLCQFGKFSAQSIKPIADKLEFGIEFDWYGQMVINGRAPFGKNKGGKGIPPSALNEWMKMKRLKAEKPK
jgi:hypothetical protein